MVSGSYSSPFFLWIFIKKKLGQQVVKFGRRKAFDIFTIQPIFFYVTEESVHVSRGLLSSVDTFLVIYKTFNFVLAVGDPYLNNSFIKVAKFFFI